jgi:hypothetical protein
MNASHEQRSGEPLKEKRLLKPSIDSGRALVEKVDLAMDLRSILRENIEHFENWQEMDEGLRDRDMQLHLHRKYDYDYTNVPTSSIHRWALINMHLSEYKKNPQKIEEAHKAARILTLCVIAYDEYFSFRDDHEGWNEYDHVRRSFLGDEYERIYNEIRNIHLEYSEYYSQYQNCVGGCGSAPNDEFEEAAYWERFEHEERLETLLFDYGEYWDYDRDWDFRVECEKKRAWMEENMPRKEFIKAFPLRHGLKGLTLAEIDGFADRIVCY